jgi:hypothetical protein
VQFFSERDAKQFLADKIFEESQRQGTPLSDVDRRLLLFSEQDPGSEKSIPAGILNDVDLDWEFQIVALLKAAYGKDKDNPKERQNYLDAMARLKGGDHYILVMADQVFPGSASQAAAPTLFKGNLTRYVVGGIIALIAIIALVLWKAG